MHTITILLFLATITVAYRVGALQGHARRGRKFRAEMLEQHRTRTSHHLVA